MPLHHFTEKIRHFFISLAPPLLGDTCWLQTSSWMCILLIKFEQNQSSGFKILSMKTSPIYYFSLSLTAAVSLFLLLWITLNVFCPHTRNQWPESCKKVQVIIGLDKEGWTSSPNQWSLQSKAPCLMHGSAANHSWLTSYYKPIIERSQIIHQIIWTKFQRLTCWEKVWQYIKFLV